MVGNKQCTSDELIGNYVKTDTLYKSWSLLDTMKIRYIDRDSLAIEFTQQTRINKQIIYFCSGKSCDSKEFTFKSELLGNLLLHHIVEDNISLIDTTYSVVEVYSNNKIWMDTTVLGITKYVKFD